MDGSGKHDEIEGKYDEIEVTGEHNKSTGVHNSTAVTLDPACPEGRLAAWTTTGRRWRGTTARRR